MILRRARDWAEDHVNPCGLKHRVGNERCHQAAGSTVVKSISLSSGLNAAGVEIDPHQRRHTPPNSTPGCPSSLGHASTETTQLYALLDDKVADSEIRAARRHRNQATS
ncbi:hypothetical protein [Microtetraspora glauca]|uniref:Integrase n=1 Tax=Microtetraspora glauca TaxID=1996 RepID=A0ABV3GE72_MICGL